MSKIIDETGNRYGDWEVVRKSNINRWHCVWWVCQKKNGEERHFAGIDLRKGQIPGISSTLETKAILTKKNAKARGKEWALTKDEVINIMTQPCIYCGGYHVYDLVQPPHNGIDRIDSSKGYIQGNVVPCCKYCNQAKNDMSLQEFQHWVKRVYKKIYRPDKCNNKEDKYQQEQLVGIAM